MIAHSLLELVASLARRFRAAVNATLGPSVKAQPIPERIRRRQGGFTLVEVLVVLGIIGLVMSLVGPRVLGYLTGLEDQSRAHPDGGAVERRRALLHR